MAFFYCWADKIGTQRDEQGRPCVAGNYEPVWETAAKFHYTVKGKWPENLWKDRKLSNATYDDYLFKSRDGVLSRKRNLDACRERELKDEERTEMEAVVKRIRTNTTLCPPFPRVPQAEAWLRCFHTNGITKDEVRYPLMVVLGHSHTGKTEWVKSLFKNALELKIGSSEVFPAAMQQFQRRVHDAIILDDVRDLKFIVKHQDKLQGKYDARIEFASTPGGQLAYERWLFCIPIAVTCNHTTANLGLLETDDFLGLPQNRELVHWPPAGAA